MDSPAKVPISVVIIAKNEEKNLPDCLESVAWTREILVVDDDSSDRTAEIAKSFGAKVITRKMDVEGKHRNFAYSQANCEWVLSLDADERVSPELAREIEHVIQENDSSYAGYSIPVKTFIGKRWIRYSGYYPARKLRLHRKGTFRYEETNVHPRAYFDGRERPLSGDIIHYGYRDFTHFVSKLNNQTTLEAQKWLEDKRSIGAFKVFYKTFDRFFRHYFLKEGYRDGFLGFMMCVCHALYQLFTYAKYLELKNGQL